TSRLCCASPYFDSNAKLFDHFLCLLRGKESLAQMPPHERLSAGSDGLGHQFAQRCDSFLMMTKISAAFCDQGAHPNRGRFLIEQAQSSNGFTGQSNSTASRSGSWEFSRRKSV